MNRAAYQQYLRSPWWRERSRIAVAMAGRRCEFRAVNDSARCTAVNGLEVHHRNYERLGAERDADLEVLCRLHHLARHVATTAKLNTTSPVQWRTT